MGSISNDSSTSSIWDRAFLLSIITIFSVGTLFGLGRLFPLSDRLDSTAPLTDFEQAPDDADDGGDGDD
jgi:hypothetical protein